MASEDTEKTPDGGGGDGVRHPLSPAKKKRLQKVYEHATKQISQENYDYATQLLMSCVSEDPGNLEYVQSFMESLQKKYGNNKKGANFVLQLKERGSKSAMKKALGHDEWMGVIRNGLKVLTVNPWDVPTLRAMATASEKMGDGDVELYYLKSALPSKPNDPELNLQCAEALRTRRLFDQAIACLHRVEKVRPDDEEVQKMISRCALEKTMARGGLGKGDPTKRQQAEQEKATVQSGGKTREQMLEEAIRNQPSEVGPYLDLSQIHIDNEDFQKAEDVLGRAYKASNGDPDIRERWEDVQLRNLRLKLIKTEDQAKAAGTDEAKQALKQAQRALVEKEVEVYEHRVERYSANLEFKFKLGQRYQMAGRFDEAIKQFQAARSDPRRKGLCLLALGQCFQKIHQNRLAIDHYEQAIKEISDRDADNKKMALYLAGRIALKLEDFARAEKYLSDLAALDFSYRDVRELLDKIAQMQENEGSDDSVD